MYNLEGKIFILHEQHKIHSAFIQSIIKNLKVHILKQKKKKKEKESFLNIWSYNYTYI